MNRFKETAKSIIILLLIISASYLTVRTWIYDATMIPAPFYETTAKFFAFLGIDVSSIGAVRPETNRARELGEAVRPNRCAVTLGEGRRYGEEYDQPAVDMILDKSLILLGEAIGSASKAVEVTKADWRMSLRSTGIYYEYPGSVPLAAVALWQGVEPPAHMSGRARKVALAIYEEKVSLYYVNTESGKYYRCATTVSVDEFRSEIDDYQPNNCVFAFEREELEGKLADDIFLFDEVADLRVARSEAITTDDAVFNTVLQAFEISRGVDRYTRKRDNAIIAVEGSRSLTLSSSAVAEYRNSGEDAANGLVIYIPQGDPTEAALIESIRVIAANSAGLYSGDAEIYLKRIEYKAAAREWTVSFGYILNGAPVFLSDSSDAATFRIQDGILTYARIHLRRFTLENEIQRLMPVEYAGLLASGNIGKADELGICYKETRDADKTGILQIGWYGTPGQTDENER